MAEGQDTSQEKTEEPTPRKLQKAREDGQVARSKELQTTVLLVAAALALIFFGPLLAQRVLEVARFTFSFEYAATRDTGLMFHYLGSSFAHLGWPLAWILLVLLTAAITGPLGLGGWNFSTKSIAFKGNRINPLSGLKRMFSMNSLVELLKSYGKVGFVGTMAVVILFSQVESLRGISREPTEQAIVHALTILAWSFLLMCLTTAIIAAIDIPFQIYSHTKKLRMTFQEVKEEYKNTEGKPEVKAKIRQLQREIAEGRMMSDVPKADVVITNPDHYAVALQYDQFSMPAPILLAKGVDDVALKIREIAFEYNIEVVQMPPLARALYHHSKVGEEVPAELYLAVAQVLAYVYQLQEAKAGRMERPKRKPDVKIPPEFRRDD
ncbi:flagellar biosynthesis protein FlhB [Natronospirillum operosum]|uniref:Flagellar biosynthetic protein FlhB n=1 Tax=Natronospirillum operosum TaxID=2759953 RepID=A0A4Z0WK29_9GAMM|nr:flagellar biosynthesis protein FlhB [Natronospirillum operosum]TGG95963.1 flagellar biosynthesis protein FlhB [Natronospirillum operosum]